MFFFKKKQDDDTHRYGTLSDGSLNTIHSSSDLSIEVDDDGRPTAVWFRCLNLPFHTWRRSGDAPADINPSGMEILNIEYRRADVRANEGFNTYETP